MKESTSSIGQGYIPLEFDVGDALQFDWSYAIEPIAFTPASGWEKGQVEIQVKTVRGQVFTPKLYFDTLEDLNIHLEMRCEALTVKPHLEAKTRSVADVFSEEQNTLRPLGRPFDGYGYSER